MEPTYQNALLLVAQIARAQRELMEVDQSIDTIEAKLMAENNALEITIAYDKNYTNADQRKLAKYRLQQDNAVILQCNEDLADQKLEKQSLRNQIDEWRMTLTAMQLEMRRLVTAQETANLETVVMS